MNYVFYGSEFNGDISKWNTSNVKSMVYMFSGSSFNGDISDWDVGNVTDMRWMFSNSKFNGDISRWKINTGTIIDEMFVHCPLQRKPPIWYKNKINEGFDFAGNNDGKSAIKRNTDIIRSQIHDNYRMQHIQKINDLHTSFDPGALTITDMVLRDQYWYITRINDSRANSLTLPTLRFKPGMLKYFMDNNIRFSPDIVNEKYNEIISDL